MPTLLFLNFAAATSSPICGVRLPVLITFFLQTQTDGYATPYIDRKRRILVWAPSAHPCRTSRRLLAPEATARTRDRTKRLPRPADKGKARVDASIGDILPTRRRVHAVGLQAVSMVACYRVNRPTYVL